MRDLAADVRQRFLRIAELIERHGPSGRASLRWSASRRRRARAFGSRWSRNLGRRSIGTRGRP